MNSEELCMRIKRVLIELEKDVDKDQAPKDNAKALLQVFRLANIGIRLTEIVAKEYPEFHWNECPTEIITYLEDRMDEVQEHI